MYKLLKTSLVVLMLLSVSSVNADDGDILVGDVDLSGLGWGVQTCNIELENTTDYLKFIVSNTDLLFEGVYTNPEYKMKKVYIIEPHQKIQIAPEVKIPGNYGTATIKISLYDVIDTLDALMPWSKFYEQPFIIKFTPSDAVLPYLQERVTFPPRVDVNPFFNNEFTRILLTLLGEGKSAEEIAEMNECDPKYVQLRITELMDKGYLTRNGDVYQTRFPFISKEEAEDGKKIADALSDTLSALIGENLKSYFTVIDSLTALKVFPNDSNDFISGASLLFKPAPVVSTLVLWYELGRKFITRTAPLLIYNGTDICNAEVYQYMYMVDGGAFLNGSHFYSFFGGKDSYSMMFSDNHLLIECNDKFNTKAVKRRGVWKYEIENLPEFFIVDTAFARPLINLLTQDTDELLATSYKQMMKNSTDHGHHKMYIGHRYWFWNLTATLTLEKLFKSGALSKRQKEFYRFDKVKSLR